MAGVSPRDFSRKAGSRQAALAPRIRAAGASCDRVLITARESGALIWTLSHEALAERIRGATAVCLDPGFREKSLGETPATARDRYRRCHGLARTSG